MDDMAFLNTKFNIKGQNKIFEILRLKLKKKIPQISKTKSIYYYGSNVFFMKFNIKKKKIVVFMNSG